MTSSQTERLCSIGALLSVKDKAVFRKVSINSVTHSINSDIRSLSVSFLIVSILAMSCKGCNKSIRVGNDIEIVCNDCCSKFHGFCVNISGEEIKFLTDGGKVWRCDACTRLKRQSISHEASVSTGEVSLVQVVLMLKDMREDFKRMERDLGNSIERCHTDIEDILKKVKLQEGQLSMCLEKIDSQATEIKALKKDNEDLHRAVSDLQQYTRANCLELHNYPQEKNENLLEVVKSVGKALGHEITDQHIDNCHRLPTRIADKPAPIIIKLTRRIDKEELLRRRRVKRDFSTRHLNLPTDIPLYLNESLSPERRRLLSLARTAKVEQAYKYLWIRNGRILMRKTDGKPVITLETVKDLDKLTLPVTSFKNVKDLISQTGITAEPIKDCDEKTIVSLSISTWLCLMLWQFSQFVLATQTLAVLIMCNLTVISKESTLIIILGQMLGVVQSLAAMFGNELLLTSIFTCLLLSSISTLIFVSPVVEKRWNFVVRGTFVMSFVTFLTLVLKTRVFTANQDSHILNILKSKLTNFKDFHSLLYVCAPEFDFLGWEAVRNLNTTWLLPTCILVFVVVLFNWLPLFEFYSKTHFRPLKNLEPDVVYTFLQCGMFAVMAGMVMRLKLFLTPHLCIVSALIRSQKYFKNLLGTTAHWGLFTIIVGGMCAKGYSNLMTQRNVEGEYSNVSLEELLIWIESNTERNAVFGGTMPIMASVLLSTQRPIVNHPHYEDAKLRERTKKVYSIYSRKPPEEVFKTLSSLGVEYVVLSRSWCYRESSSGCKMSDLWDVEDPDNQGKPEVCKQLISDTPLPFLREFSNQEYTVLRLTTPYVEFKGVKQVTI